jgi:hypothetical protein
MKTRLAKVIYVDNLGEFNKRTISMYPEYHLKRGTRGLALSKSHRSQTLRFFERDEEGIRTVGLVAYRDYGKCVQELRELLPKQTKVENRIEMSQLIDRLSAICVLYGIPVPGGIQSCSN